MAAFLLAIKAWGIWSRLGSVFSALAGWASKNPWPALAVLLFAGNVVQLVIHRRDVAARTAIAAAQKGATAAQVQVNQQPALTSANLARQSDAQAPAYYGAVASAAAAHDVIVHDGTCPAGNPDLPGPDPAAPVHDGSAAPADMVSRSKADDDLIVAAAGRAAKMHQDALDLITAGVAVPDDAPMPAPSPTQGN